jgi:flagellar basal-body rod protein FlgB
MTGDRPAIRRLVRNAVHHNRSASQKDTTMPNRLTDALDFQAQALSLRSDRQRLIASTIANADTPGYVARDMKFADALRDATGGGAAAGRMTTTSTGHLALNSGTDADSTLKYAAASQTNLDRNTVDMDRERASFADNALKYEATLRFINNSVKTMVSAITGQ